MFDLLPAFHRILEVVVTGSAGGRTGSGMADMVVTGSVSLVTRCCPSEQ
jgi:hypothetical protein